MLPLTIDPDNKIIYIDHSTLNGYRDCMMKGYWQYSVGARKSGHTPATYFGTKWHEVMYSLWGRRLDDHWDDPLGVHDALAVTEDYDLSLEDNKRNQRRLRAAVGDYLMASDPDTMEPWTEVITTSRPLVAEELVTRELFKWKEWTVVYCGVVDRVIDVSGPDQPPDVMVVDYKTNSWNAITDHVWKEGPQFKGYVWIMQGMLAGMGLTTNRFLLDMFMTQAVTTNKFLRRVIEFEAWEIDEWMTDRVAECTALFNTHKPWKEPACNGYGKCPYTSLCSQPPRVRDGMLSTGEFKVIPWDMGGSLAWLFSEEEAEE